MCCIHWQGLQERLKDRISMGLAKRNRKENKGFPGEDSRIREVSNARGGKEKTVGRPL